MSTARRITIGIAMLALMQAGWGCRSEASEPRRLTDDGRLKFSPCFSDEGRQIVYSVHENPTQVLLKRLTIADGAKETLLPSIGAHQWDPAFSPDGRFWCYARSTASPQLQLVINDAKRTDEALFSSTGARDAVRSPSIAPDGTRVAFSLSSSDGQQIASVDMSASDFRLLTRSPGINSWPAYSPKGDRIAFGSSRAGDFEIHVMNADGSETRRLTKSPGMDVRPAWSPDGKRLAFTTNRDGNYEVYVMNADGSEPRNLTNHPGRDDFPAWSPDGRHVLLVSERAGKSDLYLFDAPNGE